MAVICPLFPFVSPSNEFGGSGAAQPHYPLSGLQDKGDCSVASWVDLRSQHGGATHGLPDVRGGGDWEKGERGECCRLVIVIDAHGLMSVEFEVFEYVAILFFIGRSPS